MCFTLRPKGYPNHTLAAPASSPLRETALAELSTGRNTAGVQPIVTADLEIYHSHQIERALFGVMSNV
ncbi:hypothetical protein LshimejAT787_0704180 [Lyophyllum shimeji]|uniref:Uncharacterized protein n=1 Tax=Lyophyllum shimeji TaxID=47721 RepID=A0A9P3UNQ1_LYOSH|nr:hypothetical protein LshimejAT787_0704180 [Lyophyllum shimeji]